jgi:plasmid stabilization system protein ParE
MALARPIVWSPEADHDLELTLQYLEENWTNSVIQNFLNNLFDTLDWIAKNPDTFMQTQKSDSVRQYVLYKRHTLYFEIFETQINLLRIFDN